ncbi:MAG TPA: thymidine phosphorylase family protein [Candidatus Binataceae bacterium]|jgi:thymidine phosphorylase|nr:thymidine phosphorylase family protein [Candidatus Binataceae bacterium]
MDDGSKGGTFRIRRLHIDTLREHVVVINRKAVTRGNLGFNPMDRARIIGVDPQTGQTREVTGVLDFCDDEMVSADEIGLTRDAFRDLGLPEGAAVSATLAVPPRSVDRVRDKLRGRRLDRAAFDAILTDVVHRRYSQVELAMFVMACALRALDLDELVDYTRAMIATGSQLRFDSTAVLDKHCIGGVPGNRTTMVVVPILAAHGLVVPKTSSRAITSPAGTADTMGAVAEVELSAEQLRAVVEKTGACIAWGGALELAPADDILITVERPMELDTEQQMVASILAKKKSVSATHVLIDIPVGPTAKVRTTAAAQQLAALFRAVAERIELRIETLLTEARGPVGRGVGPRLEALDVLAVLRREPDAPVDLREKSLFLAARLLEMSGVVEALEGYRAAQSALSSGAALRKFEQIVEAQGARELPPEAPFRAVVSAPADGRIRQIDCWRVARLAKLAGAPANISSGVRLLRTVGDIVARGEPLLEIHAESEAQLGFARSYAASHPELVGYGF